MSSLPQPAAPAWTAPDARVVGDWLLHPVPLVAAAVLAWNDLVGKPSYPGWFTGKLSDVAGLVFFPLLLVSLLEVARWCVRLPWRARKGTLLGAVAATGLVFSAINLSPQAGEFYALLIDALWPQVAAPSDPRSQAAHVVDPTDLLALPALLVPWALGRKRLGPPTTPLVSCADPRS